MIDIWADHNDRNEIVIEVATGGYIVNGRNPEDLDEPKRWVCSTEQAAYRIVGQIIHALQAVEVKIPAQQPKKTRRAKKVDE